MSTSMLYVTDSSTEALALGGCTKGVIRVPLNVIVPIKPVHADGSTLGSSAAGARRLVGQIAALLSAGPVETHPVIFIEGLDEWAVQTSYCASDVRAIRLVVYTLKAALRGGGRVIANLSKALSARLGIALLLSLFDVVEGCPCFGDPTGPEAEVSSTWAKHDGRGRQEEATTQPLLQASSFVLDSVDFHHTPGKSGMPVESWEEVSASITKPAAKAPLARRACMNAARRFNESRVAAWARVLHLPFPIAADLSAERHEAIRKLVSAMLPGDCTELRKAVNGPKVLVLCGPSASRKSLVVRHSLSLAISASLKSGLDLRVTFVSLGKVLRSGVGETEQEIANLLGMADHNNAAERSRPEQGNLRCGLVRVFVFDSDAHMLLGNGIQGSFAEEKLDDASKSFTGARALLKRFLHSTYAEADGVRTVVLVAAHSLADITQFSQRGLALEDARDVDIISAS